MHLWPAFSLLDVGFIFMATDAKSKGVNDGGALLGSAGALRRETRCCVCIVKPPVNLVVAGHVYTQGNFPLTHVDVYDWIWEGYGKQTGQSLSR